MSGVASEDEYAETMRAARDGARVDAAAMEVAQRLRSDVAAAGVSLTWEQWGQLTARMQSTVARALRLAFFAEPDQGHHVGDASHDASERWRPWLKEKGWLPEGEKPEPIDK